MGECVELTVEDVTLNQTPLDEYGMAGKIGIYNITYEANKNIIHSIGGRRDRKSGALKWDLKDQKIDGNRIVLEFDSAVVFHSVNHPMQHFLQSGRRVTPKFNITIFRSEELACIQSLSGNEIGSSNPKFI